MCTQNVIILYQVADGQCPYVLYRSDRWKCGKEGKMKFRLFIFITQFSYT